MRQQSRAGDAGRRRQPRRGRERGAQADDTAPASTAQRKRQRPRSGASGSRPRTDGGGDARRKRRAERAASGGGEERSDAERSRCDRGAHRATPASDGGAAGKRARRTRAANSRRATTSERGAREARREAPRRARRRAAVRATGGSEVRAPVRVGRGGTTTLPSPLVIIVHCSAASMSNGVEGREKDA